MEPDRLAALVDYQGRVLAGGPAPRLFLGRDENVSGRRVGGGGVHLYGGRTEVRPRAVSPGRTPGRGGGPGARGRLATERARQRDPGGREHPEKPSTRDLPPKPPLPGPLLRQFRPLLCQTSPHATTSSKKCSVPEPNTHHRATRQPRATAVIFHENPQVCKTTQKLKC